MKKKAISQIEQDRALAVAILQKVPAAVDVPENSTGCEMDDVTVGVNVLEVTMVGEDVVVQEVCENEGGDMIEDNLELEDVIEEGELAHNSLSERGIGVIAEDGDFDTENHTDRESESESEEEENLSRFLVDWNARHSITREAMKDLLGGLRFHNHLELPLDPRTLLRTNLAYSIEDKCGGSYVYMSVTKSLQSALSKVENVEVSSNTELHLQFNIDGIPVFNSGTQCIWPILSRVVKPFISPVFVVALYAGRKKPNNFNEFLQPFVEEMTLVLQSGVPISAGVTCKVTIHSFVCDAPARADVKGTKHVNYNQGCDRCTVQGTYTKERRMTFNSTKSARRLDADFDLLLLPNEYRVHECVLRTLQVGMVSQFPVDYMHLTLLGLVRRMARDWQDGLLHSKAFPFHVRRATINALQAAVINLASKMPHEFQRQCRAINECD